MLMEELLDSLHIDYFTFNVEEDIAVKESIIKYSKWTEFPQLYQNSKLIGDYNMAQTILPSLI
jgi:glutaredoxin-related protein